MIDIKRPARPPAFGFIEFDDPRCVCVPRGAAAVVSAAVVACHPSVHSPPGARARFPDGPPSACARPACRAGAPRRRRTVATAMTLPAAGSASRLRAAARAAASPTSPSSRGTGPSATRWASGCLSRACRALPAGRTSRCGPEAHCAGGGAATAWGWACHARATCTMHAAGSVQAVGPQGREAVGDQAVVRLWLLAAPLCAPPRPRPRAPWKRVCHACMRCLSPAQRAPC